MNQLVAHGTGHAPLFAQPSSMFRTVACHGWANMSAGLPDEETDEAREGTATHWVGEQLVSLFTSRAPDDLPPSVELVGRTAPNGVIITEEMFDGAMTWVNEIFRIKNLKNLDVNMETPVAMPDIHAECWGTPDAWLFDHITLTLYVLDFKYGHRSVTAFENWQLMAYALGILSIITNGTPLGEHGIKVQFTIVQPRCYDGLGPYRRWEIPAVELRGYVNQMNHACAMSQQPDPSIQTGPHCRDCPARGRCNALQGASSTAVDLSTTMIPRELSEIGLAYEIQVLRRASELLTLRKEALESEAESRMKSGITVPGFELEQGYSRDKWTQDDDAIRTMASLFGVSFDAPRKLMTPSQAKNTLKSNNIDPSVLEGTYGKTATSMKLVENDNSLAKHIFSQEKI